MKRMKQRIAVVIPCHNEELTVRKVATDFKTALPEAEIHVFDNCSTDRTSEEALAAGAFVHFVAAKGKGVVVRAMFREIDADLYIMVDGDDTYPPDMARELLKPVTGGEAQMVVGARLHRYEQNAFRRLHVIGNKMIVGLINTLFQARLTDALSGYRVFSRYFVKTMPVMSKGFEIETEMTLHALENNLGIKEIPVPYGARPAGSVSKLSTFKDGWLLLRTIVSIFKDYRPLGFFVSVGIFALLLSIGFGSFVTQEFMQTGEMTHPSTAVLAASLFISGFLSITTGLVLDTVNRRSREQYILLADHVLPHIERQPLVRKKEQQ